MDSYRLRLEAAAPVATPWLADTLWGHLCWALARRAGERELHGFLAAYARGEPPLILSDGFPADLLPRPMLPPPPLAGLTKADAIAAARRGKAAAGGLVDLAAFERMRRGETVAEETATVALPSRRSLAYHNQLDRRTSSAGGDSGALYTLERELVPVIDIYVRVTPEWVERVRAAVADVALEGYGKRRAVGYGAIRRWALEPFDGFGAVPDADGFVSLSRFVPAASDPVNGRWRTTVKFGKVGGEAANPFKRPLVQLVAGSWFRESGSVREWYGRIVRDVSPTRPEVVHYGLAFALPMRTPKEEL